MARVLCESHIRWKERINFWKLSSDQHTHAPAHTCAHTLNKCDEKTVCRDTFKNLHKSQHWADLCEFVASLVYIIIGQSGLPSQIHIHKKTKTQAELQNWWQKMCLACAKPQTGSTLSPEGQKNPITKRFLPNLAFQQEWGLTPKSQHSGGYGRRSSMSSSPPWQQSKILSSTTKPKPTKAGAVSLSVIHENFIHI